MATGQATNSTSTGNLAYQNPHVGFSGIQHKNTMPPFAKPHFQFGHMEMPSHIMHNHHGDMHALNDMKPFSLPSLASITANLTPSSPETSLLGPHRSSHHSFASNARRFSPLGITTDSNEAAPLEQGCSNSILHQDVEHKPNLSIAVGNRPRSRSLRSAHSILESSVDSETPKDESGSDSGRSDKKKGLEDPDVGGSAKKRSRTLTTPTQQRRLMQILEQTRFPSTDLREQLARELGMTPRRVQIWFQNRRQGMKKAQEQRAEQEATVSNTTEYGRARGYSFGAYPVPPDTYSQSQGHQQPSLYTQGLPAYTSVTPASSHQAFEQFSGHLYAPRSSARDGMPRQLPQLQIQNNASTSSLSTLNESACSDFAWSEPSATSSNWTGTHAGYSMHSAQNVADRERMFPFGKQLSHPYESSHIQEFPTHVAQSNGRQDNPGSRSRSHTNPDFFQFGELSHNMQPAPLSHTDPIHQSNLYQAQNVFRKPDEHSTPTQRLVKLDDEGSPDRPHNLRTNGNGFEQTGLRDQVGHTGPGVWNDALSRLDIADYRSPQFMKPTQPSPERNHSSVEPNLHNPQNVYPLDYSTPDFTNESIIGRTCGQILNGLTPPDYVEFPNNTQLHLTEPHLMNEANDSDNSFHRNSSSPGHNRQRSRSFNG